MEVIVAYFKVCPSVVMEELRKSKKTPSQNGRNSDRDSNDLTNAKEHMELK
jgi:hypothetical protein